MSEGNQLHLNWNNFGDNLISLVKEFRDDKDFHDVTLLCEDGVMIPANKFLMSCCSSFFKFVFKRTLQANVVIYLKGVKGNHMKSILDFIYYGQTNVNENQLSSFLQSANDLKICGLVETNTKGHMSRYLKKNSEDVGVSRQPETEPEPVVEDNILTDLEIKSEISNESPPPNLIPENVNPLITSDHREIESGQANKNYISDSDVNKYLEKVTHKQRLEKMEKRNFAVQNTWPCTFSCTICGKAFNYKHVLENHIETHMDNSYPCEICQKHFKTRNSLKSHLSQRHRAGQQSTPSKAWNVNVIVTPVRLSV